MNFDKWLEKMTTENTDLALEADLILEFATDHIETRQGLENWYTHLMLAYDDPVAKAYDILYQVQRADGWIADRELPEFKAWLRKHPNQNWQFADIKRLDYEQVSKMFGYLMVGIQEIMDAFCPDDEELAGIVLELGAATEKAIKHCEDSDGL